MPDLQAVADEFIRAHISDAACDFMGVLEMNPELSDAQIEDVLELIRHAEIEIDFEGNA